MKKTPDFSSRTSLLIGDDGVEKLRRSAVAVFGTGGVGSFLTEALARAGVGTIAIIDPDTVQESNLNRQSIALHSTIGQKKTAVMEQRLKDINPDIRVIPFDLFLLPENTDSFFQELLSALEPGTSGKIDYIADAVDTVSAKLSIIAWAKAHDTPVISCMGTGNKLHPELFQIADISKTEVCPLSRVMRRELKKRRIDHVKVLFSKEPPVVQPPESPASEHETGKNGTRPVPGSISFVPSVAGLMIAGEIVRDLIAKP